MRPQIVYGERSKNEGKQWRCSNCDQLNEPIRKLVFSIPKWKCGNCGHRYLEDNDLDFSLGNVMVNGHPLVQKIFHQRGPECMAYASCQALLIMHVISCILKNRELDEQVMSLDPAVLINEFFAKYPLMLKSQQISGLKKNSVFQFIKMALMLRNSGMKLPDGTRHKIGDVCTIAADNLEAIFESLADGIPLLAVFYPGLDFLKMQYCRVYCPPHLSDIESCNQQPSPHKRHVAHMVVLLGPACKNGNNGVWFVNSHGEVFCPRHMEDIPKAVKGGIGKVKLEELYWNVIKFQQLGESGGETRLVDEDEDEDNKYKNDTRNIALVRGSQRLKLLRAPC